MFQPKRESEAKRRQVTTLNVAPQAERTPSHDALSILLEIASCDVSYKKYEITLPLTPNGKKTQLCHASSKDKACGKTLTRIYCCFLIAAEVSLSKAA